jgi:hypothetical protein
LARTALILELRVEQATDHVKQVAQEAAVIGALSAFATITAAMAVKARPGHMLVLGSG